MAKKVPEKILFIVDDEPIQCEMLKDYLEERFTYSILVFENGEDAIKALHKEPEIVILDFHLNSTNKEAMNGLKVLELIKEQQAATEVVMLSGQDKIETAIDTMKFGAYDYVIKGETAFSRIENIINNISAYQQMKLINVGQRKAITLLTVVFVLILLWCIYFFIFKQYT